MPVVGIPIDELKELIGENLTQKELIRALTEIGCDVEGFNVYRRFECKKCMSLTEVTETEEIPAFCSVCGFDFRKDESQRVKSSPIEVIRLDLLPVRPDLFDAPGLSRSIRGYLGYETGLPEYKLNNSEIQLVVDNNVTDTDIRPFIVAAIIKNVKLDDDKIKWLMILQEKLHWALGRNRKHASIGIYDYDKITPPLQYLMVKPDSIKFVPLGLTISPENEMTLNEILDNHPKGKAFAHLLKGFQYYPLLWDVKGTVLSMPPIINSENTKVTKDTKNLFIDVTGTVERVIHKSLNIVVSSILEGITGVEVEQVTIVHPYKTINTPNFTPQVMNISPKKVNKILGMDFTNEEIKRYLEKMRHKTTLMENGLIKVEIPAYRNDIIHDFDLIEDVAIAYGYKNFPRDIIKSFTIGESNNIELMTQKGIEVLTCLGFLEIMTLPLTNEIVSFENFGLQPSQRIEIANPVSVEQNMLRQSLLPGLMEIFQKNISRDLPQKLFEFGDVTILFNGEFKEVRKLSIGICDSKVGFTNIKEVIQAFGREFGFNSEFTPIEQEFFISGRGAKIIFVKDGKSFECGIAGEIHPLLLEKYNIVYPISLTEINFNLIIDQM